MAGAPPGPKDRRLAALIFVAFTSFYVLFAGGHIYTPDGSMMFQVTESMVQERSWEVAPLPGTTDFGGAWVEDPDDGEPRFYSWYGLGQSLAAVPGYLAGLALQPLQPPSQLFDTPATVEMPPPPQVSMDDPHSYRRLWYSTRKPNFPQAFQVFFVSLTGAWVTGLTLSLLYLLGRELGQSRRGALVVVVVAGVCSPLWHYAQTFFSEPLAGLLLVGIAASIVRSRRSHRLPFIFLGGLLFGGLALTKVALLITALPLALFLFREARPTGEVTRAWTTFALGALPGLLMMLAYNQLRFSDPLSTGYGDQVSAWTTPFWEGLTGLLVSPGRGLLLYFPGLLALGFLAPGLRRDQANVHDLGWTLLATLLLLYARWHMWEGGWCWGPRFLLPALPLLALPAAGLVDDPMPDARRRLLLVLLGLSLVVALSGNLVNFHDFHQWLWTYSRAHPELDPADGSAQHYALARWRWEFSPLVRYWRFGVKETMFLPQALRYGGPVLWVELAAVVGLSAGALGIRRVLGPQGGER